MAGTYDRLYSILNNRNDVYGAGRTFIGSMVQVIIENCECLLETKTILANEQTLWVATLVIYHFRIMFQNNFVIVFSSVIQSFIYLFDISLLGEVRLEPGAYTYTFQCLLPPNLPTSIETEFGYIESYPHSINYFYFFFLLILQ